MNLIKKLIRDEEGQGLVEYALIVGLIALAVTALLVTSGSRIVAMSFCEPRSW